MRKKINKISPYIFVTILLVLEVTTFFNGIAIPIIPRFIELSCFLFVTVVFINKCEIIIHRSIFIVLITLLLLIIIQGMMFEISFFSLLTYPCFTIIVPYFAYRIVGYKIFEYLVAVIFYTAILSTIIWFMQNLFPPLDNTLQHLMSSPGGLVQGGDRVSLAFVYTISHWKETFLGIELYRNPGLYHEPGAFAYFLILAIGLNTIITNKFIERKNIVMFVILLSTFSTAGYAAVSLLIIYGLLMSKLDVFFKSASVFLLILIAFISYNSIDFMQEKIEKQYAVESKAALTKEYTGGRITRVRKATTLLESSPLLGRGIITASRDFLSTSPYFFTGAGLWRTLSSYGFFFGSVILFFFYRGILNLCLIYNFNKKYALVFLSAIFIGATSQRFFTDNITMLLFVIGVLYNKQTVLNKKNSN